MKIIIIHKNKLVNMPPVISAILNLKELGHDVVLIDNEVNDYWRNRLRLLNVKIYELPMHGRNILSKVINYLTFRYKVFDILKKETNQSDDVLLWIEGANTIVSLGTHLKNYKYVLHILELHEQSKMQLKAIGKVIHEAKAVFIPEYNRTCIYQAWFNLKKRPYLLPNKPYFLPSEEELQKIKIKYNDNLKVLEGKKVLLYQGGVSTTRMLDSIAKANVKLGYKFQLVILGPEQDAGTVKKVKEIDTTVVYIPFLPAPDYLVYTSIAHIGYVCYRPTSLNNLYCAPNKINEFSAFSVPMLGNDIPGLKYIFQETGSGVVADMSDVDDVTEKLLQIDNNYKNFKSNAYKIYANSDNVKTIKQALLSI